MIQKVDPEIFFKKDNASRMKALRVCVTCETLLQCRNYRNAIGATHGMWAGDMMGDEKQVDNSEDEDD